MDFFSFENETAFQELRRKVEGYPKELIQFHEFTLHNHTHVTSCINILRQVLETLDSNCPTLENRLAENLTTRHQKLLYAAVCLHDLGMFLPLQPDETHIATQSDASKRRYLREEHPRRVEYLLHDPELVQALASCGLMDQLDDVRQLCEAHGKWDLTPYPPVPRRLGALLSLADVLDVGNTRAPKETLNSNIHDMDLESRWHWLKHYSVFNLYDPGTESLKVEAGLEWTKLVFRLKYDLPVRDKTLATKFLAAILAPVHKTLEHINGILRSFFGFEMDVPSDAAEFRTGGRLRYLGTPGLSVEDSLRYYLAAFDDDREFTLDGFRQSLYGTEEARTHNRADRVKDEFCQFLEKRYGKYASERCEDLAKYYGERKQPAEAARYHLVWANKSNLYVPSDVIQDAYFVADEAADHVERAHELLLGSGQTNETTGDFRILIEYGRLHRFRGEWASALKVFEKCKALVEGVLDRRRELAEALRELGSLRFEMGAPAVGIQEVEKAQSIEEELVGRPEGRVHDAQAEILQDPVRVNLAKTYKVLGNMYREHGQWDLAGRKLQRALDIMEKIVGSSGMPVEDENHAESVMPPGRTCRDDVATGHILILADCYRQLGNRHAVMGHDLEAEAEYKRALELKTRVEPAAFQHLEAAIEYHLAKVELRGAKRRAAILRLEKCERLLTQTSEPKPIRVQNPIRLSFVHDALGLAYLEFNFDEALKWFLSALRERSCCQHDHFVAFTRHNLARLHRRFGRWRIAFWEAYLAVEIWRRLLEQGRAKFDLPDALATLGHVQKEPTDVGVPEQLEVPEELRFVQDSPVLPDLCVPQDLWGRDAALASFCEAKEHYAHPELKPKRQREFLAVASEISRLKGERGEYLVEGGEYRFHTWLEEEISHDVNVVVGVGDDAAVLDIGTSGRVVLTTDTAPSSICGTNVDDARYAAKFSVVHAISDLLAMGATPVALLFNLHLDRGIKWEYAEAAIQTVKTEAAKYGAVLIGGDLKERSEQSFGCVGVGVLPPGQPPLLRKGVKAGDIVAISLAGLGNVNKGDARYRKIGQRWCADVIEDLSDMEDGTRLLMLANLLVSPSSLTGVDQVGKAMREVKESLLFLPHPKLVEAVKVKDSKGEKAITAAIDTSDGFMSCLEILARESNRVAPDGERIGFVVEQELIESVIDDRVQNVAKELGYWPGQFLFNAGHDWEIVMTVDADSFTDVRDAFKNQGSDLAPLGRVVHNQDKLAADEIGLRLKTGEIIRVPVFTDEKFVARAYQERLSQWAELNMQKRIADRQDTVELEEYKEVPYR